MPSQKPFKPNELKVKRVSREQLESNLEYIVDQVQSGEYEAVYISKESNSAIEAVLIDIREYEYICEMANQYKKTVAKDTQERMNFTLEQVLKKVKGIEDEIRTLKDVR